MSDNEVSQFVNLFAEYFNYPPESGMIKKIFSITSQLGTTEEYGPGFSVALAGCIARLEVGDIQSDDQKEMVIRHIATWYFECDRCGNYRVPKHTKDWIIRTLRKCIADWIRSHQVLIAKYEI